MASSDANKKKAKGLLEAASSGNLRLLKEVVRELNEGQGIGIADKIKGIKDANGDSAFHLAAYHGRTEICQYFVEELGLDADFSSEYGDVPLFDAVMGGHAATASYLISHGANPVSLNKLGSTPLHWAASYGQDELVNFFLSLGVPVDVNFNQWPGTPLTVAALCGHASTMKILLEHHADVNGATNTEFTPIRASVHAGNLECTKLLIKAGADLNLNCPLAMASNKRLIDILKCLLEAGADPNVCNEHGWLPIETAGMGRKWDIVEMLFPLTSPMPELHEWSVQAVLQYVKSNAFVKKIEENFGKNIADLKVKGADLFRKKEYAYAYFIYGKAITVASMIGLLDAALFSNRSLCSYRMGEGDRAWKDALLAQRLRPDWSKAYYRIGAALMLLKEYEQASLAFISGLLLDPTNTEMKEAYRYFTDLSLPFPYRKM
ncbi:hypothetical protein LUZ61_016358 [Rhynchospora tenuis]|uniref:Ankyrin n=1 Tax=Rhynchospora tenuis TaxID=198213 RepID=A0AAD5Z5E4_9POAL|nr:hypothetical protein LUZ61_016358 [Rhynchospora tenuis]